MQHSQMQQFQKSKQNQLNAMNHTAKKKEKMLMKLLNTKHKSGKGKRDVDDDLLLSSTDESKWAILSCN